MLSHYFTKQWQSHAFPCFRVSTNYVRWQYLARNQSYGTQKECKLQLKTEMELSAWSDFQLTVCVFHSVREHFSSSGLRLSELIFFIKIATQK